MNLKWILAATVVLSLAGSLHIEAKRLTLRPMSAREVYRVLKEAGRESAVPEGRVVTQGIAAITGFALGITKGIGGALLADLATSNATQQFISNLNVTGMMSGFQGINMTGMLDGFQGINMSAITGLFNHGGAGNSAVQYQTQEICFSSRSLNEIDEEESDVDENEDGLGRRFHPATGSTGTLTTATLPTTSGQTSPTTSTSIFPTATGTTGGSTTGSNTNSGTGTQTKTDTVTQTGTGGSVNCVVIQKPVKS